MEPETTARPVTSTAARWCAVVPASLIALFGLLVTLTWGPAQGLKDPHVVFGLPLAASGSWSAVAGWKDPVRGVRRLSVAVIALELLLFFVFEMLLWTASSEDPPVIDARRILAIGLGLPPAYLLLRHVVGILQDRARA